ncbi:MAG: single-stranded-DNA-specific exonuclease RecJ [Verrucomicrobiota bacterium]
MNLRWSFETQNPALAAQLAADLAVSPLLAQCLLNRGHQQPDRIRDFLEPRLKHLADPFLLPNMAAAVDRLCRARQEQAPVIIFGDYDVDGVTSTALLTEVLGALGWTTTAYLPHRIDEGYGLSREAAENCLAKSGCLDPATSPRPVLLAVDCGSTSIESIAWLRSLDIDVIVLDHHQISNPAPPAHALVNPRFGMVDPAGSAAFTELCSAGLAFKLAHALVKRGRDTGLPQAATFDLRPLLDLVALATIADVVPLTGESRILVTAGLERLNHTTRPGLSALRQVAESPAVLGARDVAFQLAPRLNAAGRLESARDSLDLLLCGNPQQALDIARRLDARNRERQKVERAILDEATQTLRARFNPETDWVIVEGRVPWHVGVVGIVASRILQEFHRPTIILGGPSDQEIHWRGSGRSIPGFDLAQALQECNDLLARHGGHAMAAGLSIHPDHVDAFRKRLNDCARRCLKPSDLVPALRLDAEVSLEDLTLERLRELTRLHPLGQSNPPVQLAARNVSLHKPAQFLGADRQHVKLWLTDGGRPVETVWWGAGKLPLPQGRFDIAFVPQINDYNGRQTVQLRLLDWKPA